jgi:methylase of polypeptide subunit release factors
VLEQVMDFGGLRISFDPEVLEPRPWTVEQSRWATALLADAPPGPVLELCAGAGQIGLVVARDTGRPLVQVDVDERACDLARRNAADNGLDADVRCGELERAVPASARFAFVLADPPYVPSAEVEGLGDPTHAVDGGADGLDVARRCLRIAAAHLPPDGLLLIQLGSDDQCATVAGEAGSVGLAEVERRIHGEDRALLLLRRN